MRLTSLRHIERRHERRLMMRQASTVGSARAACPTDVQGTRRGGCDESILCKERRVREKLGEGIGSGIDARVLHRGLLGETCLLLVNASRVRLMLLLLLE